MGHFCNKNHWLKKLRSQKNPETWRAKSQSLASITKKTVIKFLNRAKLAIFRDLVMHCNLFYDEIYPCYASFFADSRILKRHQEFILCHCFDELLVNVYSRLIRHGEMFFFHFFISFLNYSDVLFYVSI